MGVDAIELMYALLQTGRKRASPDVAKDSKKSDAKRRKPTASKGGKKQQEEAEEAEDAEVEPDAAADLDEDIAAGSDADSEEAEADTSEDADEEMEDATAAAAAGPPADDAAQGRTVGSGRRAAQGNKVYKDQKQLPKKGKADEVKRETVVKTEKKAWEDTAPKEQEDSKTRRWGGAPMPMRRVHPCLKHVLCSQVLRGVRSGMMGLPHACSSSCSQHRGASPLVCSCLSAQQHMHVNRSRYACPAGPQQLPLSCVWGNSSWRERCRIWKNVRAEAACVCLHRRLLHFEVTDAAGELQPLDRLELLKEPLKLTGNQHCCPVV